MPTWRLILLSLLLCTTWLGCSDDPNPGPDGGTVADSGTGTTDSGTDSGTGPMDSGTDAGTDAGTNPVDSGTDAGTDAGTSPEDSGTDAGTDPVDSGSDSGTDPEDSGTDAGTPPVDGGTDGGSSGGDAGSDAGVPDDSVRVRRFIRNLTASGYVAQPEDFSRSPVELLIPRGDALVPVTGMAGGPGEYVFPDVPQGTYYLRFGTGYVVTDARSVDLSVDILGRPDVVDLESEALASVSLTALEPWFVRDPPFPFDPAQPRSELQVVSEQVGFAGYLDPELESGATSLTQDEVLFYGSTGPIPQFEADKGDRAWVLQLNPRTLAALPDGGTQNYITTVRALQLPAFSNDGGTPVRFEGALQPLTLNEVPLDWRISSFAAHAAEVNPAATLRNSNFVVHPAAYGPAEGWVGYSGELLRLDRPRDDPSDVAGTLVYGNPYPSSWGSLAIATTTFSLFYEFPEEPPLRVGAGFTTSDQVSAFAVGPLVPRIRPPRQLTLDGTAAYTARTLEPGSHVLAWQPPAARVPDAYTVNLRRLDKLEDTTFRFAVPVGSFYVDGSITSIRLPAGILQPGQFYYLTVRSILAEGYDVSRKPFSLGDRIVVSGANTLSGLLTVPPQAP